VLVVHALTRCPGRDREECQHCNPDGGQYAQTVGCFHFVPPEEILI